MSELPLWRVPLEDITEDHLQGLVAGRAEEGQHLDFKRDGYGRGQKVTTEIAKDVSSMTNGGEGLLLIGVDEESFVASDVCGVANVDSESKRIRGAVMSGIEPRLRGFKLREVPLSSGRFVIVVRCPRSIRRPHMVTAGDDFRFWVRQHRDKRRMTHEEVREAFARSRALVQGTKDEWAAWLERIARTYHGRSPCFALAVSPVGTGEDEVDIHDEALRELLRDPPLNPVVEEFGFVAVHDFRGVKRQNRVTPCMAGLAVEPAEHRGWLLELTRTGTVQVLIRHDMLTTDGSPKRKLNDRSICGPSTYLAALARRIYEMTGTGGPFVLRLRLDRSDILSYHDRDGGVSRECAEPVIEPTEREVPSLGGSRAPFFELIEQVFNGFGMDHPPPDRFDEDGVPIPDPDPVA